MQSDGISVSEESVEGEEVCIDNWIGADDDSVEPMGTDYKR